MSKPKIAFVIHNFLVGGVERFIFDLLDNLLKRNKIQLSLATVFGAGPLEKRFRALGIPLYSAGPFKEIKKKLPFKLYWFIIAPVTLFRLLIWLKQTKPNVVVTSLYLADILGILAAYTAAVPHRVVIQHDVQRLGGLKSWLKKYLALRLATHIVANSETTKEFLIKHFGVAPERVVLIPNGIDLTLFRSGLKSSPPSSRDLTLGFVGRLEPVKGPIYFVEALGILKDSFGLEPRAFMVGDGSLRPYLEQQAVLKGISRLEFWGLSSDVPTALREIDILVVPSLAEGFGLVVLEGLVAGKVVVASNLPAVRELLGPENELLFPPRDARALALRLAKVLRDYSLFLRLRQETENWFHQQAPNFDIQAVADRYRQLFRSCISAC